MNNFNIYDYARDLSHHHIIFYKIMELGNPIFDETIKTACIVYQPDTGRMVFALNKEFFESLNKTSKLFMLCHEALHILYEHPFRAVDKELNADIANIAQDIVINELLLKEYGFLKEKLNFNFSICLVDTVFNENQIVSNNIAKDMTFMEYYKILEKEMQDDQDLSDKIKSGFYELDKHNNNLTSVDGKKGTIRDMPIELVDDLIETATLTLTKKEQKDFLKDFGQCRTYIGFGESYFVKEIPQQQQKVWQDLVKSKIKSLMNKGSKLQDSFRVENRKFGMLAKGFVIPGEDDLTFYKPEKYNLYFFMDISGSCFDYKDEFFNIVRTVPEKFFNIRLFSFDTRVVELDIKSPKVYGGGGTRFDIIESKIQETLKEGDKRYTKYPDLVMVLSDGDGNKVSPERPKNWTWLLTQNDLRYIDIASSKIMLTELKKRISLNV